jgi:YD repeat-containing protein
MRATILDVLAVSPPAAASSARQRSCRSACRRARPHGCVENRWYPGANRKVKVEWDFEDRLVKVTKADGTVVENTYDVDGVLVRTSVNGVATDYLVDTSGGLSHVVAEVDSSGAVTVLYVRSGNMLLGRDPFWPC